MHAPGYTAGPSKLDRPGGPLLVVALLVAAGSGARAEEPPYPPGRSRHEIEGLRTVLLVPEGLGPERRASLLVGLHGAGGTASQMADSLGPWVEEGFVVCAPTARDVTWEHDDVERVAAIARHLRDALPVDAERVHVLGYSNGGAWLHRLAFDDDLRPRSATWIASGCVEGQVPRWARERLGALVLVGSRDPERPVAERTVGKLENRVRTVEVRVQEGLGHGWPSEWMDYLRWWMGVMEGRFRPGEDLSFEWSEDLEAALASLEGQRRGGVLLYVYDPEAVDDPNTRALQHEVFFDPKVRALARRLRCVKWSAREHEERAAAFGVEETPAVVVLDHRGRVEGVHQGAVPPRRLTRSLRAVAPRGAAGRD